MSATKDFGHWFNRLLPGLVLVLSLLAAYSSAADDNKQAAHEIVIVLDTAPGEVDARVADVLKDRIQRCCGASVEVSQAKGGNLRVYLGQIGLGNAFDRLCAENGVRTPGRAKPFAEGYAVKTVSVDGVPSVIAAGADKRGTLYAAGELLRQMRFEPKGVILTGVDVSTAPAYRYRGSSANQGGTMLEKTGARGWTEAESQDYMLDLALSGANCLYAGGKAFDFVKSFDLMSVTGCRPNELNDPPKEWRGTEWGNWVCPSIPEAREALRKSWAADFPNRQAYDVMRIYAGDPGGCRCPRCTPWGKTFVELCEEAANVWLESHPGSVVQIANQDLTNDGDQAIFDYLNAQPRPWLEAIAYGPGSNAMSDYFRSELREDLFEYPGDGPVNRYLAETLNQLPKQQKIVHYSDITHWISAQYQVEHPEPNIARIYGRRTFHARPKAFYRIFKAIMPFSEGDIIYSEGYHDEFHQYLWNRLLWDPNQSLDEVVIEYCALHFGDAAAPLMRDALYQMEDNLEAPLATNPGIDRYYLLVKEAGWQIPAHLMMNNHRWRLHMQKAALDKYLQLALLANTNRDNRVAKAIGVALADNDANRAVAEAAAIMDEPNETPEMTALRAEAGRLGEESNAIFGVRSEGYFALDNIFSGKSWSARQVKAAASMEDKEAILRMVADYENPGEGGFYDDAGEEGLQPHLIRGDTFDAAQMLDPANRPSQNTVAYSLEEPRGVAFRYTALDPKAQYRVRVTLAMPRIPKDVIDLPRDAVKAENLLADDAYLAEGIEVPSFTAKQFEYDVPKKLTQDGTLDLTFERVENGIGCIVSEVWLMKRP